MNKLCRIQRQTNATIIPALLAGLLLLAASGCRTVKPLPPANLSEPDWTVRQGQAVWKRGHNSPEIIGEIILATRPDGRVFVQFTKDPFPLMIAQSAPGQWQVEIPTQNKHYSGRGKPPKRLILLYLPRVLAGQPLPKHWSYQKMPNNGWRLENHSTGESLEVYFSQ